MAIDRIPGVGPQNSDIAAAVAAPSAATIASAVNAPSAATIAAAVAAPSAATIATQVAASVPTLAQINTSVSNNAPSPNNWVLLGTGNLQNVNTSTVNFSSYRSLRIIYRALMGTTNDAPAFRLNGDSGTNYYYGTVDESGSPSISQSWQNVFGPVTYALSAIQANNPFQGEILINGANLTGTKLCKIEGYWNNTGGTNKFTKTFCFYLGTSAITSFTILNSGGFNFRNDSINSAAFQVFGAN